MRKRSGHSTQNENESEGARAALHGATVIQNIFGHRETQANHSRIDDAVDDPVEFVFLPKEQDQKNESLRAFLDDWLADYSHNILANLGLVRSHRYHEAINRVQDQRDADRNQCTPKERD